MTTEFDKFDDKKKAVLQSLKKGASVTDAMEAIGMDRTTFYVWKKNDSAFAAMVLQTEAVAIQVVEDALWNKAADGHPTAMIFYLCNRAPKRWKNVQRVEFERLPDILSKMTDEQLREFTTGVLSGTGVSLSSSGTAQSGD